MTIYLIDASNPTEQLVTANTQRCGTKPCEDERVPKGLCHGSLRAASVGSDLETREREA